MPRTRSNSVGDIASQSSDLSDMFKTLQANILQSQANIQQQIQQMQQIQANLQVNMQQNQAHLQADIQQIQQKQAEQFTKIDGKLQNLYDHLEQKCSTIQAQQSQIHSRLDRTEERMDGIENNVVRVETQINSEIKNMDAQIYNLKEETQESLQDIKGKAVESLKLMTEDYDGKIGKLGKEVIHNQEKIASLESKTDLQQNNFQKENGRIKDYLEKENQEIQNLREELNKIKKRGVSDVMTESSIRSKLYLKAEMWPKFRGYRDKINPMTFLKNVQRLTANIPEEDLALDLIRISLTERALEWFESVNDHLHTVKDFSDAFKKQYWNPGQQDRVKIQLLTGQYHVGPCKRETYACDLFNKCQYIEGLSETEIVRYILKHFITVDSQAIICQNVNSLEELMEILRRLDDLSERQLNQRISSNYNSNQNRYYNQENTFRNNGNNYQYSSARNNGGYQQDSSRNQEHNYQDHSHRNNGGYQSNFSRNQGNNYQDYSHRNNGNYQSNSSRNQGNNRRYSDNGGNYNSNSYNARNSPGNWSNSPRNPGYNNNSGTNRDYGNNNSGATGYRPFDRNSGKAEGNLNSQDNRNVNHISIGDNLEQKKTPIVWNQPGPSNDEKWD